METYRRICRLTRRQFAAPRAQRAWMEPTQTVCSLHHFRRAVKQSWGEAYCAEKKEYGACAASNTTEQL